MEMRVVIESECLSAVMPMDACDERDAKEAALGVFTKVMREYLIANAVIRVERSEVPNAPLPATDIPSPAAR